jgi:transposase
VSGRQALCERDGPHREGEEPKPMMYGREKSDPAIVAVNPSNKARKAHCGGVCGGGRSGVGGAKGGGQGEYAPAQHVLDSEPSSRVTGVGAYTATLPSHTRGGRSYGAGTAEVVAPSSSIQTDGGCPVVQVNDLSRSLTVFDPISTLVVVVEMSKASWLVSGIIPGVERQPLKKLEPDATALLRAIERWRSEAVRAGRPIRRIALAYEAGRDGFWLARWLIARGIEAHVIHSASVAVSRERKRAKTDRLDAAMLMRVFLGWLRGERGHCGMVAIPTMEEEDARRPSRERESLVNERSRIINRMKSALARLGIRGFKPHLRRAPERLACLRTAEGTGLPTNIIEELRRDMVRLALVREQITSIEKTRAERLERAPDTGPHAMVRLLSRVIGIGIETADMLVREILSRKLRDRRALARYAGLTGSPDESGLKSREKGLAKAGNARVRRGLIQLAWRFLMFQKDSALAQWYRTRTEGPSGARKTTMIAALARKLLIALWRLVTTGEIPDGVELRPAA